MYGFAPKSYPHFIHRLCTVCPEDDISLQLWLNLGYNRYAQKKPTYIVTMNLKRYNLINLKDTEILSLELKDILSKKKSTRQIVFLEGDLGTGKTTLAQHLLKNLGVNDRVKSPTYTLIEPYQGLSQKIYHLDLYRLQEVAELTHLGLDDLLQEPAIFLVEWPDKLKAYGVMPDLTVYLTLLPDGGRTVELAY